MNAQNANPKDQDIKNANLAVEKAYKAIVKEAKQLLTNFPTEELRTYIERTGTNNTSQSFYCQMAYISIADYYGKSIISFAKNMRIKQHIGPTLDTLIVRAIYEQTSVDKVKLNITDRLDDYPYYQQKYDDAVKFSTDRENYKLSIANTKKQGE